MWTLLYNDAAPRTVAGALSPGVEIVAGAGGPRAAHAVLFELQGDLRTDALVNARWTFQVEMGLTFLGPGAVAYGAINNPITGGIQTQPGVRTSLYYRCLIHLLGHWSDAGGPFGVADASSVAIREDTGQQSTVAAAVAASPSAPAIGDLAGASEMVLRGFYAPWRFTYAR